LLVLLVMDQSPFAVERYNSVEYAIDWSHCLFIGAYGPLAAPHMSDYAWAEVLERVGRVFVEDSLEVHFRVLV